MILLNLLVSQNVLSELEARAIEEEAKNSTSPIDEILAEHNVSDAAILTARNAIYGIPVYSGSRDLANETLYNLFDQEKAERYLAIPLGFRDLEEENNPEIIAKRQELKKDNEFIKNKDIVDEVLIGIVDPERKNVLDALQFILTSAGVSYKIYLISFNEFKRRFDGYSSGQVKAVPQFNRKSDDKDDPNQTNLIDITDEDDTLLESLTDSMPMVKMVNVILKNAIVNLASDIHIEDIGTNLRIRTRIDGILATRFMIPVSRHASMVARIKILCNLKLDEKRKPQDGRFSVKYNGHKVDFRVSTLPTYYGEKVVIRILDSYRGVKKLEEIGFSDSHLKKIRAAIARPYGMVLISGPTGSGKSTTLYSMINELDKEHLNIVSLEDPIEYNIPGISQSQIFPEIGYTFATGLRSILRQDPNVIFVGEIRDGETAQLAIQAALTGHLVFSTIHTNNAIGVVTRLMDMGVDPYLIAPTLNLAIAQRLARKIAKDAGEELNDPGLRSIIQESFKDLPDEYKKELPLDKNPYKANSTAANPSGLKGRIAVFEMLEVDTDIENLILHKASEEEIWKAARKKGMININEDGMIKSIQGIIPFTEAESV